jgi:transcriptional regulator with XRE-family HTH domain
MTQEDALDATIRARVRGLRLARGWSLDALAARCQLSPSTLSRIETGHRRIAIDQLVLIARALGTSLDQLVEPVGTADVIIRPRQDAGRGSTTWMLTRADEPHGLSVAKVRITDSRPRRELRVHPGTGWFTVLSGTIRLQLGDRVILVEAGQAAQFSAMSPHAVTAHEGPAEVIFILDKDGRRAHLDAVDLTDPDLAAVTPDGTALDGPALDGPSLDGPALDSIALNSTALDGTASHDHAAGRAAISQGSRARRR